VSDIDKYMSGMTNRVRWTKSNNSSIVILANEDNLKINLKFNYMTHIKNNGLSFYINNVKIGETTSPEFCKIENIKLKRGQNILELKSIQEASEYTGDWYPRIIGYGFDSIEIEEIIPLRSF